MTMSKGPDVVAQVFCLVDSHLPLASESGRKFSRLLQVIFSLGPGPTSVNCSGRARIAAL